jgi:hypothetical protein
VSIPCESPPHRGVNDPAQRFANLKARYYQELADAFERNQVAGLTDEETIAQLSGILYEIDSQGRMKIESQEKARERGAPSPDRAEALMLALWKPPPEYAYIPARDPSRQRSRDGGISMGDDDQSSGRAWRVRGGWGRIREHRVRADQY